MFCSNCGIEVQSGNFCWNCGNPLRNVAATANEAVKDWSQEVRYEALIRIPEVRELVRRHAAMARKRLSGENFLALCDKVIPLGVSMAMVGSVAQPIFAALGVKTGKAYSQTLPTPPGTVMVSALCSLARNGQALQQVRQVSDGCLLEAALPSDVWSWQGVIYVSVRLANGGTRVDGATSIKGQAFDWGKSSRCLAALFADLKASPA
jgi:hypothetical protein